MSEERINLFRIPEFTQLVDRFFAVLVINRNGKVLASSSSARILFPALITTQLSSHLKPSQLQQLKSFFRDRKLAETGLDLTVKGRTKLQLTIYRLKADKNFLVWIRHKPAKAEKNELLVKEFMHTASHQLLTPLTISQWYSQLFLEEAEKLDALPKQFREFITEIQIANNRMQGVVSLLLAISSLESDRYQAVMTRFELKKVIRKSLEDFQHKHNGEQIQLEFKSYHQLSCQVRSDKAIISRVLGILLDNSAKYNASPLRKITVSLRRSTTNSIIITVRDNGTGIALAEQKRIFSKFFRTETARKATPEGNGLGLYFSKLVLKTIGAKIWFKSKPKQGSAFSLKLAT
jgi:two-component system phosphate regulon sensor histidine kinase PhoR